MAIRIGPKGYIDLFASEVGSRRRLRIVSITGLAANAEIANPFAPPNASKKAIIGAIDMSRGLNVTSYIKDTGSVAGDLHFTQADTGGGTSNLSGNTIWCFIGDTGTSGN